METYILTFRQDGTPERLSGERRRTRRRDNAATLHAASLRQDSVQQTESLRLQRDSTERESHIVGKPAQKKRWHWLVTGIVAGAVLTIMLIRRTKRH